MQDYSPNLFSMAIILGAGIMLVNIIRFRKTVGVLDRFDPSKTRRLRLLGRLHQGLMAFFLVGYAAVAYAISVKVAFISELFVVIIFFLGSVFVWLGILLQHQMISMIQARYEQASETKAELEIERQQLEETNTQLNLEVEERRRAESALRESEQRLKFILDQLPAGILIIDEATKIIKEANPAALKLIGLPRYKVVGSHCHHVVCAVEEGHCPMDTQNLEIDNSRRMLIKTGGREIPILKTVCRITLDGQRHLLESFIDISDKERLEAQLQRVQKMEALGTLAGGVAHDLNNILSGIVSYPDLLLRDLPSDSPLRRPIKTIKTSGEKAATIVQDMLTLARRNVGVTEVVNLKQVVRDYLISPEHNHLKLHHPNVTFSAQVVADLFFVSGSIVHLFKTVMNLCSNAAEAMPEGGAVVIKAENRYVDRPLRGYDTVAEGDYVVLSVSDTGIGIAEEDQDRIFEPFFTKKTMGRSGTGLGMAVVWGTVKDHQGYINVESASRRGTTFTLYFPATRRKLAHGDRKASAEAYFGCGESILIVDDVAVQRQIATDILTALNYNAHAVSSGEAAVEYLQHHRADLILLDMIMDPGMSGLQTYQKILKSHPGQRAVLVSGFSETDDVRKALQIGAGEYIKKPYTMEAIAVALRKSLGP